MFPVSCLRIRCFHRAVVNPPRLMKNRLPDPNAGTGHSSVSTCCHRKDTCHSNINFRGLGKERGLFHYNNKIFSPRSCSTSEVKPSCWKCKQLLVKTPSFFCSSCQTIQPPEEKTSYFNIMDCDYTFTVDTQKLQTRYLQLQRSLHPDNFSQKSVKELEYSESQSALVNKAYETLLKPLSRGLYMLELQGMHLEEGTDAEADPDFLLELMEINEALDEAQTPEEASKIGHDTKGKLADLTVQIDAALHKEELHAARALLTKMKYYANIEDKVKEKLSEFM
ncbi:iron-sulfur cluster co-chaperone protein HscB [Austrofundulus limnaeus]|uniref:Iron-sulfur cluster co-chaperone protein HscB n=1 Tax=Austrofundulus limnaeus TaxID=52670 RepID=A0A2I4CHL6_AUSLI|nr:PREDICTED: iron-sulfur cluster co-chaperone protein HscB, mitochondrial [Austrofundulus limnaeus]